MQYVWGEVGKIECVSVLYAEVAQVVASRIEIAEEEVHFPEVHVPELHAPEVFDLDMREQ